MSQSSEQFHSRDQEEVKFDIQAAESSADAGAPLPDAYGDDRLVILPRDPACFFAYWELTPARTDAIRRDFGQDVFERGRAVLRVYTLEDGKGNGSGPGHFFDVGIRLDDRSAYVEVPEPDHRYNAELGLVLPDGQFIALLRSNTVRLPRGRISDILDNQWMSVRHTLAEEEWAQLMQLSGASKIGMGSAEASKIFAQRWEFLRSIFSAAFSRPPSSQAWPTSGKR